MSTPNMSLTLPVDHGSSGVWDTILDAVFTAIDSHNHTTGQGVAIPVAGLNINADLAMGSFAVSGARAFDMQPVTSATVGSYSSALFTNSADNNLYFRNSGGTNVQITSGNTLNVTVAGAIGGDYGSVGALLDFIDASDTYHFYQQLGSAVRQYAGVAMGNLDIFEQKAQPAAGVPANRVRHKSPAALAASYDLTWLTALPAANTLLMVDNTGAITAPTATITLPNNANVVAQGTGDYKYGTKTLALQAWTPFVPTGSISTSVAVDASQSTLSTGGGTCYIEISKGLWYGDRIKTVAITGTAGAEPTLSIIKSVQINAASTIASTSSGTIVTNNLKTLTVTTPAALAGAQETWWLKIVTGASTFVMFGIEVTFDRP